MTDVHNGHNSPGFKLFGKTITLQVIKEIKDEPNEVNDHDRDRDDDDNDDETLEKRVAPDKIIPCPRCKSMETKFCYFNNYNVNQPRHFCKGCQRYWTAGGALRNVPVGAGRRKTKPPGRELLGGSAFSTDNFFESSGIHQLDFDGLVEEWHVAAAAAAQSDFRHVLPTKRRRSTSTTNSSGGQSC